MSEEEEENVAKECSVNAEEAEAVVNDKRNETLAKTNKNITCKLW